MTLYLWHMVPVVLAAIALYPTGLMPQPPVGSEGWWLLRVLWVLLLAALLVPLTALLLPVERRIGELLPMDVGPLRPWAPLALGAGVMLGVFALDRFAVGGFAPAGRLPATTLAAYGAGIVLIAAVPRGQRTRSRAHRLAAAHRPATRRTRWPSGGEEQVDTRP